MPGLILIACNCAAVIYQQQSGVLAFEAENGPLLTTIGTGSNFQVITTTSGVKTLPAGSPAVGAAALYANRTVGENGFATYQLAFISDGTYHLYTRYSFYEVSDNTGYGNEDSYYSPMLFNQEATLESGWNAEFLATHSHHPLNNPNEGQFFYWDAGTSTYNITGASEENPMIVTFTIRMREGGGVFDRFVFSTTTHAITSGVSSSLDAIASVPEPGKFFLLTFASMGLMFRRNRLIQRFNS